MKLQKFLNIYKTDYLNHFYIFLLFFTCSSFGNTQIDQLENQIQQIDQKIVQVQSNISQCNNTLKKLTQDSSNAARQYQNSLTERKNPISNLELSIINASKDVDDLKKQMMQIKQDSLQLSLKYASQKNSFNQANSNLQQQIATASNNIKTMNAQREQHLRTAAITSNNATTEINTENARIDLMLSKYHNELNNLNVKRAQLVQDSAIKTAQLYNDHASASKHIREQDSIIVKTNRMIQELSVRLGNLKKKHYDSQMSNKQVLQSYTTQRAGILSSINLNSANLSKNQNNYNQIRSSLDATMTQYEKGKAPLQNQLRLIDSTLHTRQMQKSLWSLMSEKISIDSSISVARNELDQIIQEAALKRKNGMKMSEQKEAELNALMGKVDFYMEKPGLRQVSAQIASLTFEKKKARVREVLSNIENDIKKQTALRQQAEKALSNYERNNPTSNSPSLQKLKQFDNEIKTLQSQQALLGRQRDSLDALIRSQSKQINRLDAQFQKETGSSDSSLTVLTKKSTTITSQRTQYYQNYSLTQKNNQAAINQVISELKETDNRIAQLNLEIAASENRKNQLKASLASSAQLFEQQKTAASAAAQNLLNMITRKEQEILSLSSQTQQLTSQHDQITQQYQTAIYSLVLSLQQINSKLLTANSQYQNLLNQKNDITSQLSSNQKDLSKQTNEINITKSSTNQQLSILQTELQQLSNKKAFLQKNLDKELANTENFRISSSQQTPSSKNQQPYISYNAPVIPSTPLPPPQPRAVVHNNSSFVSQYDSLIRVKEEELTKLRTQRDRALQNSNQRIKVQPTQPVSSYQSKPAPKASPGKDLQIQSQKLIERIYALLGEGKVKDAFKLFTTNKEFLKSIAPVEAIRILESSF